MAEKHVDAEPSGSAAVDCCVAERLERAEVVYYPVCPFPLPQGDDHRFLLEQRLARGGHKNVSYDPQNGKVGGHAHGTDAERLRCLLAGFSRTATEWLASVVPQYIRRWRQDRVSLRPEEEATRNLRMTARNDLLHVDAFPTRPTNGHRILRLFANINPVEPRIWVTSEPFDRLLERYGREVGLPSHAGLSWSALLHDQVARLFNPRRQRRSVYDAFMLRFHDFLKMNDVFQEHCPKRYWSFPPGSCWLVFTDAVSHGALRGRSALEHSYFVAPEALMMPAGSPAACLQRACGRPVLNAA